MARYPNRFYPTDTDLRHFDHNENPVSYLQTAHNYRNGWLYSRELEALHQTASEEEAESLVREAKINIDRRLESWRIRQG